MSDDQLFLVFFFKQVHDKAGPLGVAVTSVDIGYHICWGVDRWLFRFHPNRARRDGIEPQLSEALKEIRSKLVLDPESLS